MKRAIAALRGLLLSLARAVGLEGLFLLVGTALLANGSAYINPVAPWFVAGTACVLVAIYLVVTARSS